MPPTRVRDAAESTEGHCPARADASPPVGPLRALGTRSPFSKEPVPSAEDLSPHGAICDPAPCFAQTSSSSLPLHAQCSLKLALSTAKLGRPGKHSCGNEKLLPMNVPAMRTRPQMTVSEGHVSQMSAEATLHSAELGTRTEGPVQWACPQRRSHLRFAPQRRTRRSSDGSRAARPAEGVQGRRPRRVQVLLGAPVNLWDTANAPASQPGSAWALSHNTGATAVAL